MGDPFLEDSAVNADKEEVSPKSGLRERVFAWPGFKVLRYADFRLLWIGSLLSFTGTQIQNVARGDFVFDMTGNKFYLSLVSFCAMIPITLIGPMMAVFSDIWDRRKTLVWTSALFMAGALYLAAAIEFGFVTFWQILLVSLIGGLGLTLEQPTRQAVVRSVVPMEDLPSAVPAQGMTFNLARVAGPAIGGILTATIGPAICFLLNGISYLMILFAALKIKADLRAKPRHPQPMKDLIFEGMLYTLRHQGLKVLFVMEAATSLFGMFYLFLLPAIAEELLRVNETGLGFAYSCVGVGAMLGLIFLTTVSGKKLKALIIRLAMTGFAIALFLLSTTVWPPAAFACLVLLGACAIAQFNTTNTLFQLLAPARLRGRVLAMHTWAVAGLAPIGSLMGGAIAERFDLRLAMSAGATFVMVGAIFGWIKRFDVREPDYDEVEDE